MNDSDNVLLEQWISQRDPEAMAAIVKRYSAMVYATCRRVTGNTADAEDLAQECFLKLTSLNRAGSSLAGLLHTMATRLALNKVRSEVRRRDREAAFTALNEHTVEARWDDIQPLIDEAIAALPEERRVVVVRHFFQGETHGQIARDLSVSRAAVSQRVAKGVEEVRAALRRRGVLVLAAALVPMLTASRAEAIPASLTVALGRMAISGTGCGSGEVVAAGMSSTAGWGGAWVKAVLLLLAASAGIGAMAWRAGGHDSAPDAPIAHAAAVAESPPNQQEAEVGVIQVVVTDGAGQPAADAALTIEMRGDHAAAHESLPRSAQSNAQGVVEFTELPLGHYMLKAGKDGQVAWAWAGLSSDRNVYSTMLVLKNAGALEGRVENEAGQALSGALVHVLDAGLSGQEIQRAQTGADGLFSFPSLPVGQYTLQTVAEGYAPAISEKLELGGEPVNVVLGTGGGLNGVARLASNNAPAPDVTVHIAAEDYRDVSFTVVTGADGVFTLESAPAGTLLLTIDDPRYAQEPAESVVEIVPGMTASVALQLLPAASVAGRVYNAATGEPLPGAIVSARDAIDAKGAWHSEPADADGRYVLAGLPPKPLDLTLGRVPAPFNPGLYNGKQAVDLSQGGSITDLDFPVDGGLMIHGVVVNENGEPVAGAEVSLGRSTTSDEYFDFKETTSDTAGAFSFANVGLAHPDNAPDDYLSERITLQANARGARSEALVLDNTADNLSTLRLTLLPRASGSIAGTIVDEHNHPLQAKLALRQPLVTAGFDRRTFHKSGPDGLFLFDDLAPGKFEIWASLDNGSGYGSGRTLIHTLALAPGERVTDLRVTLSEAGFITGTLRDDANNPIPHYKLEAWDVGIGDYAAGAFSDREGNFKIAVQGAGVFELRPSESAPGGFWRKAARAGEDVAIVLTAEVLGGTQPQPVMYVIDNETGEERIEWPEGSAGPPRGD